LIKVLLTDILSQKSVELLNEIPEFEIVVKNGITADQLKEEIRHYDAIVVGGTTLVDREIIEKGDHLQIIIRGGIGLDNIDVDAAKTHHIEVKDTPLSTAITVAEYTLAQLLGICRFIGPAYQSMKSHKWEKEMFSNGMELYGKTAGIIGMGRIGKEVAKRELAMGMKVLYYDIEKVTTETEARQVPFDELLKSSDFISVHLPLTVSTKNLISHDAFAKMKEDTIFINMARSGVVDEKALLKALENGQLKAAAIDVSDREFQDKLKLIDHHRVFPTPHLGASTVEAQERAGLEAISILKEFFNA